LGPGITLLANAEPVVHAHPAAAHYVGCAAFTFGAAASALQRAVDGIHLFNHCPSQLLAADEPARRLGEVYATVADRAALARRPRRHPVTYPQVCAPGESARAVLPVALRPPTIGTAFGRMEGNITLRIGLGPVPSTGTVCLQLGFSAATPALSAEAFAVRVNQVVCAPREGLPPPFDVPPADPMRTPVHGAVPKEVAQVRVYAVPLTALHDDVNVVEFEPPAVDGELVWAELLVGGETGG
jgi:hypothetical protein